MRQTIPFLLAALMLGAPAMAQTGSPTPTNKQPIEITATKTVEWLRNDKKYVARENVIVTQGTMSIYSDLMTADYKETKESSTQIWQLTADGNVKIVSEDNTAFGDKGVYNVEQGIATLTGENLKIISPEQTVTARDKMEYYANTREAKAIGDAKVVRQDNTLTADVITAVFKDNAAQPEAAAKPVEEKSGNPLGGGNLDRLEAEGNVVIITPSEKLYGTKGIYRADTNVAEITGKVKIVRGENILEGDRAEVDLTTNVSKMFGTSKPGSRVRGVFFPGSEKQATDKKPAQKAKTGTKEGKPASSPVAATPEKATSVKDKNATETAPAKTEPTAKTTGKTE